MICYTCVGIVYIHTYIETNRNVLKVKTNYIFVYVKKIGGGAAPAI